MTGEKVDCAGDIPRGHAVTTHPLIAASLLVMNHVK